MGSKKITTKKKKKLTPKELKFCAIYACDRELMGNGVQCYMKAYSTPKKPVLYNTARTEAYRMLLKPYILDTVADLFNDHILSDVEVDQELAYVIKQHANLVAKVAGIKHYSELKGRIKMADNQPKLVPVLIIEKVAGAKIDRFEENVIDVEISKENK